MGLIGKTVRLVNEPTDVVISKTDNKGIYLDFGSGKLMFGGTQYAPTQITDGNGNSINVLAEVAT